MTSGAASGSGTLPIELRQEHNGPLGKAPANFAMLLGLPLFIIGALGAAGVLPGAAIGGATVGICTTQFIANLATKPKYELYVNGRSQGDWTAPLITIGAIFSALFVTLGALAIGGVISPAALGWVIIGPSVVGLGLLCCSSSVSVCALGVGAAVSRRN